MSVPQSCTVLVVGGGPAGSFVAAALAREDIDVVLLEAETFPRYHIGESLLPSMRYFLKIIGFYDDFNNHGFTRKNGAAFQFNRSQPEAYTDFIAADSHGYAWNVVRSEADELLFKHAGASGARTFDGTKVNAVQFKPLNSEMAMNDHVDASAAKLGQPVSATWTRKDGSSGTIFYDYLVDASGRQGLLSTKYLKNRTVNPNLKNIADWGYWRGGATFAPGTRMENAPYFEALQDATGWCWYIPLHNGTISIGIVQNMETAVAKKRRMGSPSTKEFYLESLKLSPRIQELLSDAELDGNAKSASDWSYHASTYAFPRARICGDAGCFIDPLFSSGVHLAILGGLSAAVTIAASIKGQVSEREAISWHTKKVHESYMRFFLVVSTGVKQITSQDEPVIRDAGETGFDRAFDIFKPVIQGTVDADTNCTLSREDIHKTVEYCFNALMHISANTVLIEKFKAVHTAGTDGSGKYKAIEDLEKSLTEDESLELKYILGFVDDMFTIDTFTINAINGLVPNTVRGELGLKKAEKVEVPRKERDRRQPTEPSVTPEITPSMNSINL
ncbi:Flavin-dependent halogenase aclH [Cladobotryum mycophilum]|uniref:Flavin-dependent halogenase aclH n=1 Tax=Cladobotryum mycophilum TaxID=491253 RepID=A0ABR0S6Q1_9HYPO